MVADGLPLIPAIEARLAEALDISADLQRRHFGIKALAWRYKADAYAECLELVEKQHRAYSDASTARPVQNEEAVPALHARTAGNAATEQPQNEG